MKGVCACGRRVCRVVPVVWVVSRLTDSLSFSLLDKIHLLQFEKENQTCFYQQSRVRHYNIMRKYFSRTPGETYTTHAILIIDALIIY